MMVDFFLIPSWPSISTFSTMEDQRKGSNKSSLPLMKVYRCRSILLEIPSTISHQTSTILPRSWPWGPTWFSEDKTRNDPVLSARFAQIREAYDILGDEGQRAIYDSAGLQPLEFYAPFFLGGSPKWKVQGVLRNLGYVYILKLFTMIVVRGGSFHVQWYHFERLNLPIEIDRFLFDEMPEQMRNEQFGQL